MKNPTRQELMEFVDGTLVPQRHIEIEHLVSLSETLQKEVRLLTAMRKTVHDDLIATPSKYFTADVMKEILPVRQYSLLFRMAKNSSNIFAMVLVLSLIAIVLVSSPSSTASSTNPISQSLESFSSLYNISIGHATSWMKQYSHPLSETTNHSTGKIFFIGIIIFSLYASLDGFFGKKYFRNRLKN